MPSATMDYASRNGSHMKPDKDSRSNGINGAYGPSENTSQKGKGKVEMASRTSTSDPAISRQSNGSFIDDAAQHQVAGHEGVPSDMLNQEPPELAHITEGYLPLSRLLSRLAISSRNNIESVIMQLSEMPLPQSAVNGNGAHVSNGSDDNSRENIAKKLQLLGAAQKWHAQWLKALVITQWSRRAPEVSRLIDLTMHFKQNGWKYDGALADMAEMKRGLSQAAVPNPDLRTALEILTTGKAPWMPDLGYIESSPMTPDELLKELTNLNTILSIRLNLHEYDKIPYQFRDFTIKSGRVTFRVAGEFEVDLTVADEDPESQFWFIDFRFLFSPAPEELTEHFRNRLETTINSTLQLRGLEGCYNFLHEFTLTHKIAEFKRQALLLNRGKWIGTLKVESLHRGFSLQYWVDRYGKDGPKSWILVGVHSGKRKDGKVDAKAPTHIGIRWFRDSKEVMDVKFEFDLVDLSAEELLKAVIARHIGHYLLSAYEKLKVTELFEKHDLDLNLSMSWTEPADSQLRMQCTRKQTVTISVEPVGGLFAISPASPLAMNAEHALNTRCRDPAANSHEFLIHLRCRFVGFDITSHGISVGWEQTVNPGISTEDLKVAVPRDTNNLTWLKRAGFSEHWYLIIAIGTSGEQYYLVETSNQKLSLSGEPPSFKIQQKLRIPINTRMPAPTYKFMSSLHTITVALMSFHANRRALHERKMRHVMANVSKHLPSSLKIPAIFIRLEDLLPSTKDPWAQNAIKVTFHGIENRRIRVLPAIEAPAEGQSEAPVPESTDVIRTSEVAILLSEARMKVNLPTGVALQERVDRDIAFNPRTKTFAIRLHTPVGGSFIPMLVSRLERVHRLVTFVGVMKRHEKALKCDAISLSSLSFSYSTTANSAKNNNVRVHKATIGFADGKAKLRLAKGNPHIRILDHLTHILDQNNGLDIVAAILPRTLPLLQALDAIEDIDNTGDAHTGYVQIHTRASDWFAVSYRLPSKENIKLEIRMRERGGTGWWHVQSLPKSSLGGNNANPSVGEAEKRVMAIFKEEGDGYLVLGSSAVTKVEGGNIGGLLEKLDATIRGNSAPKPSGGRGAPVANMGAPVANMGGASRVVIDLG